MKWSLSRKYGTIIFLTQTYSHYLFMILRYYTSEAGVVIDFSNAQILALIDINLVFTYRF